MMPENEKIVLSGDEAISILKELEFMLISLHKMGSYYMDRTREEYEAETCRFIDEEKITHKLANIRAILSSKFDSTLGDDDMDDLERAMEDIEYWSASNG